MAPCHVHPIWLRNGTTVSYPVIICPFSCFHLYSTFTLLCLIYIALLVVVSLKKNRLRNGTTVYYPVISCPFSCFHLYSTFTLLCLIYIALLVVVSLKKKIGCVTGQRFLTRLRNRTTVIFFFYFIFFKFFFAELFKLNKTQ